MVTFNEVQAQLEGIDSQFGFLGIAEVKQIANVLRPGEQVMSCLKGWCRGVLSLLLVTDVRMILLEHKPNRCRVEVMSYEEITELSHSQKWFRGWITLATADSQRQFKTWRVKRLREMHSFLTRHIDYLQNKTSIIEKIVRSGPDLAKTDFKPVRGWRSMVKKV